MGTVHRLLFKVLCFRNFISCQTFIFASMIDDVHIDDLRNTSFINSIVNTPQKFYIDNPPI